jgi:hypothetical protein
MSLSVEPTDDAVRKNIKILVVDDDPDITALYKAAPARRGRG